MNIKRIKNEFSQYGITPSKLINRFSSINAPKVLANSIPKSGTNMLARLLYLMPPLYRKFSRTITSTDESGAIAKIKCLKGGQFAPAHLYYSDSMAALIRSVGVKNIIIIRDPRDIAVSNYRYITYNDKGHRLHRYFTDSLHNDNDRLMASIKGIEGKLLPDQKTSLAMADHVRQYSGWFSQTNVLTIRFEDLVGERGGGQVEKQLEVVSKINHFLGLNLDQETLVESSKKIFNPNSRTFYKGRIATWPEKFTAEHKEAFKESFGDLLITMGYETNNDW